MHAHAVIYSRTVCVLCVCVCVCVVCVCVVCVCVCVCVCVVCVCVVCVCVCVVCVCVYVSMAKLSRVLLEHPLVLCIPSCDSLLPHLLCHLVLVDHLTVT